MDNLKKRITKSVYLQIEKITRYVPDKLYLQIVYLLRLHKRLDLNAPQTFNEKLQWLKLYDRKPEYSRMVDKYEVKKYVADIIGEEYIIPTLGVWERFEEIDFTTLPDSFVLKCTHDSGGLVIVHDKSSMDIGRARKIIERSLKRNFYWKGREWPYKSVKPRIIAEKYMEDKTKGCLDDYKFFAFDGVVRALFVATERDSSKETKFDFFDSEFNHLPFTNGHPNADTQPVKPKTFDEMKRLAERLSQGIAHVRVDFYEVDGKVYFGELTFSHWSGLMPFKPEEWDRKFGEWITLPGSE